MLSPYCPNRLLIFTPHTNYFYITLFTQLLWSLSDKVGCSIAKSTRTSTTEKYRIYVVCHYAPAGNTEGKFDTYVKTFGKSTCFVNLPLSSNQSRFFFSCFFSLFFCEAHVKNRPSSIIYLRSTGGE